MLGALRAQKVIPAILRMEHKPGANEPLLWAADAICGAVVQLRTGDSSYIEIMRATESVQIVTIWPRGSSET
jgi:hypothetical protein